VVGVVRERTGIELEKNHKLFLNQGERKGKETDRREREI